MTYENAGGKQFVLSYHTATEWADKVEAMLIALGCTREYAWKAVAKYRVAVPT